MRMNVGELTRPTTPRPRARPRASSVLPAPSGPMSAITSPAAAAIPRRSPNARVAAGWGASSRSSGRVAGIRRAYPLATRTANRSSSPIGIATVRPSSRATSPVSAVMPPRTRRIPPGPSQRPSRPASGPPWTTIWSSSGSGSCRSAGRSRSGGSPTSPPTAPEAASSVDQPAPVWLPEQLGGDEPRTVDLHHERDPGLHLHDAAVGRGVEAVRVRAADQAAPSAMFEEELAGRRACVAAGELLFEGHPGAGQRDALVRAIPRDDRLDQPGVPDPLRYHLADMDGLADDRGDAIAGLQLEADARSSARPSMSARW